MIIVKISWGLGNQLYQYAFGRFLALQHNTELKLDINHLKSYGQSNDVIGRYRLGAFNIVENFAAEEEVADILNGTNKKFQILHDPGREGRVY